ncbi:MAG: type II toxin-antitoxin system RelE/ParE family toxin [Gammaproteobacteria bacterium]
MEHGGRDQGVLGTGGGTDDGAELSDLITRLASDPTCGDVIKGTGGLRKVRVGLAGRGKSGGARVIYYFYNGALPVFLLTVFAKNEKADLTGAERSSLAKVAKALRAAYRKGDDE